ncbi:hypothetical protein A2803_03490 [Candidatus Woesebacteria bacterium RIFCSPHIGHO2_01_FULL_44_21]|uniref:Uncharacterized protein n=1 Tax=Candidatus Woesebacteria bacterium RIFCSPHIGHO2_01_FULL_44_21 TaxID=1802503 RepID=A0A1F7YYR2_9BACT|nr:MAG: hypothetical protein A2803_03490 [Candidatus Woesebacteria bacterium RIFCSPHIGHO2_01_FULL_44_21]OGM69107.1 MAG: hypothetical protein A2897_04750 [Candidatus Woesebacteria bacterium RIFCSPLOWO2_01_FULL_44_24b]
MEERKGLTRREFIELAAAGGVSFFAPVFLQTLEQNPTQEATPETDPYAATDAANIRALTAIDRREGQVALESPRIIGYLEYRQDIFGPDRNRVVAVLADGQGQVYGFMDNVNCTLEMAEPHLGKREPLARTDDEFNVYYWPVTESEALPYGLRINATSGRVLDDEALPLPGGEVTAPYYALDEIINHTGETIQCPDFTDEAREFLNDTAEQAEEILGELREETGEVIDELRDWWNNR